MVIKSKFTLIDFLIHAFFVVFALLIFLPIWNIFIVSISTENSFMSSPLHLWTNEITFNEYIRALSDLNGIARSFIVSFEVTALGTILSMILTCLGGYVLSKEDLPGRKFIFNMVLITMFFGGGLLPFYVVVKSIGLTDTIFAMFVPSAISTFYLILMKSYYGAIPPSLEEAAKVDGYNDIQILFRIIIPISTPAFAAIALFYAVGFWNEYFYATLFISTNKLYPMPVVIRQMVIQNQAMTEIGTQTAGKNFEQFKMACIIISLLPIVIAYPFVQKHFTKGVSLGAIKE